MCKLKALVVEEQWGGGSLMRASTLRLPLATISQRRLVSIGRTMPVSTGSRGFDPEVPYHHIRLGKQAIRRDGEVRTWNGLTLALGASMLVEFLRKRVAWEVEGTALDTWRREVGLEVGDELYTLLATIFERRALLGISMRADNLALPPLPAGHWVLQGAFDLDLSVEVHRGRTWRCVHERTAPIAVTTTRRVQLGKHRLELPIQVVFHHDEGRICWWDGTRFGFCERLESLPASLANELEKRGEPTQATWHQLRPGSDLVPLFLLRVPSRGEARAIRRQRSAVPPKTTMPALLEPLGTTVPLLSAGGDLLPIPVVDDPAEAMTILRRTPGGRAYNPHADPIHPDDIDLGRWPSWRIACLPGLVAHS
jgi:hypothetical protein